MRHLHPLNDTLRTLLVGALIMLTDALLDNDSLRVSSARTHLAEVTRIVRLQRVEY